jgi:hypothetical protein
LVSKGPSARGVGHAAGALGSLPAHVLRSAGAGREPAALSRLVRALRNAIATPGVDTEQPRPAFRHARIMSRIATGRAYTGGTTASRLCRRETRQDASCQGEDENRRFHKPLITRRFDWREPRCVTRPVGLWDCLPALPDGVTAAHRSSLAPPTPRCGQSQPAQGALRGQG